MEVCTPEAYQLIHDGLLALSRVEANGIRIDEEYLNWAIRSSTKQINEMKDALVADPIFKTWKDEYGDRMLLGSDDQLANILFKKLGYKPEEWTPTGRPKMGEGALRGLKIPFLDRHFEIGKLEKARDTYLYGLRSELIDGLIHPFFKLHTVQSYRGSSDTPNVENVPVRNATQNKLVRRAFIAREGHVILEADFKAAEVRVGACYHKDQAMMDYIHNPKKDMHYDQAEEILFLPRSQITKVARDIIKANFVFSEFYGNYYLNVCQDIWEDIQHHSLKAKDGTPLLEVLRQHGITALGQCKKGREPAEGTFEKHIKEVENRFWKERFVGYDAWKKSWVERYKKVGGFRMLTGFYVHGVYERNQVINYPIQGSSFHCLLWTLVQLDRWLRKHKMRSLIVNQIHDSIVVDVHQDELQDVMNAIYHIVTVQLPREWFWLIVPMSVEFSVAPPEGSWYDKEAWVMEDSLWAPEKKAT